MFRHKYRTRGFATGLHKGQSTQPPFRVMFNIEAQAAIIPGTAQIFTIIKYYLFNKFIIGRRGGRMDWSLGNQRCGRGFVSQWQWVRSAIISDAAYHRPLIILRWSPRGTPVSYTNKKTAEVKYEIGDIMQGPTTCTPFITAKQSWCSNFNKLYIG